MTAAISDLAAQAIATALSRQGLDLLAAAFRSPTAGPSARQAVADAVREGTGLDIGCLADAGLSPPQWTQLKAFELGHQPLLLGLHLDRDPAEDGTVASRPTTPGPAFAVKSADDGGAGCFAALAAWGVLIATGVFAFHAAFRHNAEAGSRELVFLVLGFLLGVSVMALHHLFGAARRGADHAAAQRKTGGRP